MCISAIIAGGASLIGGAMSSRAAGKAADAQTRASNQQIKLSREIFDRQDANFAPYREAGGNALAAYQSELGLGDAPEGYTAFGAATDPNYNFALSEGMRAIDGSAAMNGGLYSGATLKALQGYGQNTAMGFRDNHLNRLAGLMSTGQASAGMTATAAGNMGQVQNNALGAIGNAQSAGHIGQANAWNNAFGNALGAWQYQQVANPGGGFFDSASWNPAV